MASVSSIIELDNAGVIEATSHFARNMMERSSPYNRGTELSYQPNLSLMCTSACLGLSLLDKRDAERLMKETRSKEKPEWAEKSDGFLTEAIRRTMNKEPHRFASLAFIVIPGKPGVPVLDYRLTIENLKKELEKDGNKLAHPIGEVIRKKKE